MSWLNRIARLGALLNTQGNEEEDGIALDRLLHGQSVIGSTRMYCCCHPKQISPFA